MEQKFRHLRADEIECRVNTCNGNGLSLLLYKDARCDMNILDETVGAMNWQRSHTRDNANCIVSIWDNEKSMWISKEDTGTESNTEAEKGKASDSFKRACFNWGIGRELYTSPFIWIPASDFNMGKNKQGKPACFDKFVVESIVIDGGVIKDVKVKNTTKIKTQPKPQAPKSVEKPPTVVLATAEQKAEFFNLCEQNGEKDSDVYKRNNTTRDTISKANAAKFIDGMKKKLEGK